MKEEDTGGRSDDPVRMYLREMGNVELLSREGEIEIAKRIEQGREMMISSLCESPMIMREIVAWRDEIEAGSLLLRDIIDIDATMGADPEGKPVMGADGARSQPKAESYVEETAEEEEEEEVEEVKEEAELEDEEDDEELADEELAEEEEEAAKAPEEPEEEEEDAGVMSLHRHGSGAEAEDTQGSTSSRTSARRCATSRKSA